MEDPRAQRIHKSIFEFLISDMQPWETVAFYLTPPPSSADVERLFSTAGHIYSAINDFFKSLLFLNNIPLYSYSLFRIAAHFRKTIVHSSYELPLFKGGNSSLFRHSVITTGAEVL